jgi:hypothetical protein
MGPWAYNQNIKRIKKSPYIITKTWLNLLMNDLEQNQKIIILERIIILIHSFNDF